MSTTIVIFRRRRKPLHHASMVERRPSPRPCVHGLEDERTAQMQRQNSTNNETMKNRRFLASVDFDLSCLILVARFVRVCCFLSEIEFQRTNLVTIIWN